MAPDKALLRHAQISAMAQPNESDVKILCEWIRRESLSKGNPIDGKGATAWGDILTQKPYRNLFRGILDALLRFLRLQTDKNHKTLVKNLIKTQPRQEMDAFTRWAWHDVQPLWHAICHKEVDLLDPDFVSLCFWKVDIDTNAAGRTRPQIIP
jgi:hypothetical protein